MAYKKGESFSSLKLSFNDISTGKKVIKTKTLTNLNPSVDISLLGELSEKINKVIDFEFVTAYQVSVLEIKKEM